MLRWLDRSLADRQLESINRTLVEAIIEAKQAEGCSNATVNRHARALAGDSAPLRARLGMARSCADDPALEGADATYSILESGSGADAAARVAAASAPHGHLRVGDGLTRGERDRAGLGSGRSVTQAGAGSIPIRRRPGRRSPCRSTTWRWRWSAAERQASRTGVLLRGTAYQAGQHEGLVPRAEARRYRGLSLSRSAPYLGELARAERDTAVCFAGARQAGKRNAWCGVTPISPRIIWPRTWQRGNHGTFLAQPPTLPKQPENKYWKIRTLWWPGVELNHRHADFQSAALPTELPGHGTREGRVLDRSGHWSVNPDR